MSYMAGIVIEVGLLQVLFDDATESVSSLVSGSIFCPQSTTHLENIYRGSYFFDLIDKSFSSQEVYSQDVTPCGSILCHFLFDQTYSLNSNHAEPMYSCF